MFWQELEQANDRLEWDGKRISLTSHEKDTMIRCTRSQVSL